MPQTKQNLPTLCLITDRRRCVADGLIQTVAKALTAGVRLIQLREKDLSGKELFKYAEALREVTLKHGALLIINGRADVAIAVKADGVHLGQTDYSPNDILPFVPKGFIVGVSTHSKEEAIKAEKDGAHYITFGPVWPTPSKAGYGKPVGIEKLREVVKSVTIPVFAIGGVKKQNVNTALISEAHGIAIISAIIAADDPALSAKGIIEEARKTKETQ
ncbi:thiamine phosphate synthase [bacterium]|nr:MAG: thiamine phosphate synthase [bacterium]